MRKKNKKFIEKLTDLQLSDCFDVPGALAAIVLKLSNPHSHMRLKKKNPIMASIIRGKNV